MILPLPNLKESIMFENKRNNSKWAKTGNGHKLKWTYFFAGNDESENAG